MAASRAKILVRGRVQGVGFRNFVMITAGSMGLKGYTKNLSNGDVETVAEGPKEKIEELHSILQKGNMFSKVEEATIEWQEFQDEFFQFEVRR